MTILKAMALVLGGIALLAAGAAIGVSKSRAIEQVIPTEQFVEERLMECAMTVRVHEHARTRGDAALERLVRGDLVGCGVLVMVHGDRIPDDRQPIAHRIQRALDDGIAFR